MFHGQVPYVPNARREMVALATSLYVLGYDLFHVRAEKILRPLLVGASDLLIERSFGKCAGAALFYAHRGTLQLRHIWTGNERIVTEINQQRTVRCRRDRPRVMHYR